MLRFFRQIRQKLILQENIRKYLLYSIGEVLLVVIGILIALQVNNWNEERKTSIEEKNYVLALLDDLENDKHELLTLIENRKLKSDSATKLLLISRNKGPNSLNEMGNLLNDVLVWKEFTPKDNTFKELISSGKLHILSSDSLRNGILNLFSMYDDIRVYKDHIRREYDYYLYDLWAKYTTPNIDLNVEPTTDLLKADENFIRENEALLLKEYKEVLQDKTFQTGLFLARMNNRGINDSYKLTINQIDELIKQIDLLIKT